MDTSENAPADRKSAIDTLERDELIRRCKKFLGIAQEAKKAKTVLTNEIAILNEKLQSCDTQKQADKECLKTMQVMIDSLTESKLSATNRMADLEKCVANLTEQNARKNAELSSLAQLQIENEAQRKQIDRLTRENEEQECDLQKLDARFAKVSELSQLQQQELLVLEQSIDRWKAMEADYYKLQEECKALKEKSEAVRPEEVAESSENVAYEQTIQELQAERDNNRRMYEEIEKQLAELRAQHEQLQHTADHAEKIDVTKEQLEHENQQLRKKCDEKSAKLNKYKSKVIEFSQDLKEVKKSKKILYDTVCDYSGCVAKWQKQITNAAQLLIGELDMSNRLKTEMEQTIEGLRQQLDVASRANVAGTNEVSEKYEKLLAEYKAMESEIQSGKAEATRLNETHAQVQDELLAAREKVSELGETIESLRQQLSNSTDAAAANEITDKYEKLLLEYKSMLAEVHSKSTEFDGLKEAKCELEKQLDEQRTKLVEYEHTVEQLQNGLANAAQAHADNSSEVKEKYDRLLQEYKALESEVQSKNTEMANIASDWEQLCAELKQSDAVNRAESESLAQRLDASETALSEMQGKCDEAGRRNDELLVEMRELNDVLKTRGNVISNQSNELDQMKLKLQEQIDQIAGLDGSTKEKTEQLQKLQLQCDNQAMQISHLDDGLKEKNRQLEQLRNQFDSQSEILSTSTISRAEEVSRMRDVEDSFEEKYNKLRIFAVKLKKRVADQQATIAKLEATAEPNAVSGQNLKSLQAENDRLLDKIDNMTIERKKLVADAKELAEQRRLAEAELKSLRIVSEDIKATADTNQRIKSALDEQIRASETQLEAMKGEKGNIVQQLKDADNEIVKVKDVVRQKDAEIQKKSDEIAKLKADIGKMQSSMKKHSVLNLEVEAYEKSLKEMSAKLETSTKQLADAKNQNHDLEVAMQGLNTEIQTLTSQLDLEKQNSNELQQQADLQQIKIKEYNGEIIELKRIIDDHVKDSNKMKIELTNLQSQQSENEIERQQFIARLKTDNEKSVSQQFALEDEVRDLRAQLAACEHELANVQTEFASYKVRAQTVLRQNQSRDASDDEELREELALLKRAKDDLTAKLSGSGEHQKRLSHTIDELKAEKQTLHERCKKLLQVVDETRQQFEAAQSDGRKEAKEYQETVKTHRLQIDTLNNCFKKQMDDMQKRHDDQMAAVKAAKAMGKPEHVEQGAVQGKAAVCPELQRIEMIMSERQAGEGSESTLTTSQSRQVSGQARGKHDLIPLDELLSHSYEEEAEADTSEPHSDKFVAIDKYQAEQTRVNHLSTLLSEAEMDVTRLTEMNAMLKEEMRRQERSEEREKHMHNLEYMKNIIFKFLTISNADERAHLLPVLNIILKLSPDESRQLEGIARGADSSQSGWRLPMW